MKLRGITIIIAFFVIIQSAAAYKYEKSKTIEKTFSCKEGAELNILNRYGDISISTWEKNEIKIEAKIVVRSKKNVVDERLNNVDITFSHHPTNISAKYKVVKMKRSDYSYSITYKVLAPKSTHLDITNYNGDNYIDDFTADIASNSKYGNLVLNNTNSPTIKINAYNGDIDIKNCGENTGDINIEGKYGDIEVDGHYNSAEIDLYNGDIEIQNNNLEAAKTKITSKYGDLLLNASSKTIDINVYNGNVKLGAETNAQSTSINNKYGGIEFMGKSKNITIESYNGDVNVTNKSIPGNIIITNKYGLIKYSGRFTMIALNNYNGNISVENTDTSEDFGTTTTKSNRFADNITITGGSVGSGTIASQYGNVKYTGSANMLSIISSNGNIDVNDNTSSKIENLIVKNAYGRVNLNNVEKIKILNANNNTYHIRNSNSIIIEDGQYSSLNIDGLKESFTTKNQLKFVKIDIKRIAPSFKNINISNSYSPINLSFTQTNDYKMDISGKFGGVKIADKLNKPQINRTETKSSSRVTKQGTAGNITIENQYGDIRLDIE